MKEYKIIYTQARDNSWIGWCEEAPGIYHKDLDKINLINTLRDSLEKALKVTQEISKASKGSAVFITAVEIDSRNNSDKTDELLSDINHIKISLSFLEDEVFNYKDNPTWYLDIPEKSDLLRKVCETVKEESTKLIMKWLLNIIIDNR